MTMAPAGRIDSGVGCACKAKVAKRSRRPARKCRHECRHSTLKRAPRRPRGIILIVQRRIEERPQAMAAAGMAQLAQRLGFDLANALPRHREVLADLFERMLAAVLQTEAHLDDLLFARAERLQN